MTLSTKSTTTSELPLRCCTTTLTMAYHHSHSRMLYLLPLLFLLLPHPCITAASWIIASLDYHCLFGPQPLFGLPRYFWITAVSTYQTKQSVTPISAFFPSSQSEPNFAFLRFFFLRARIFSFFLYFAFARGRSDRSKSK